MEVRRDTEQQTARASILPETVNVYERLMVTNNLSYWPGNCRTNTRNAEVVIRFAARFKYGVATAPDGLPDLPEVVKLNTFCLLYYRVTLVSKRVCDYATTFMAITLYSEIIKAATVKLAVSDK